MKRILLPLLFLSFLFFLNIQSWLFFFSFMTEKQIIPPKASLFRNSFDKPSLEETKYGFKENQGRENFFRKGLIDEWKTVLTKNQIKIIEDNFKIEMKELGYL